MSRNEQILEEFRQTGAEQLLPMVETGQVTLLFEEGRKIKGVMSAALVDAPEDVAWDVLLDYAKYSRFLPGIEISKVVSKKENEYVVKFVAAVKVIVIVSSTPYELSPSSGSSMTTLEISGPGSARLVIVEVDRTPR